MIIRININFYIKKAVRKLIMEFKVNKYITLKLEDNKTIIYINGEKYLDNDLCCGVLVNILRDEPRFPVGSWTDLRSNKESVDFIIDSRQYHSTSDDEIRKKVTPEEEFWAYCSNLQVWAENNYNTDLLDYHVSIPLLDKLIQEGVPLAKDVFKQEIFRRIKYGTGWAFGYLTGIGYLGKEYSKGSAIYYIVYEQGSSVKLTSEEMIEGTLNSDESEALKAINKRTDLDYVLANSFGDDEVRKKIYYSSELFFTVNNGHIDELEIELTKEHPKIPEELTTFKHLSVLYIWVTDPNVIIPSPSFKIKSVGRVQVRMHESVWFPQFLKLIFPNLKDQRVYKMTNYLKPRRKRSQ